MDMLDHLRLRHLNCSNALDLLQWNYNVTIGSLNHLKMLYFGDYFLQLPIVYPFLNCCVFRSLRLSQLVDRLNDDLFNFFNVVWWHHYFFPHCLILLHSIHPTRFRNVIVDAGNMNFIQVVVLLLHNVECRTLLFVDALHQTSFIDV